MWLNLIIRRRFKVVIAWVKKVKGIVKTLIRKFAVENLYRSKKRRIHHMIIMSYEKRFIINGKSRKTLDLKLNSLQSIHSEEVCKRPSTIPTPVIHRKLPKKRDFSIDEMQDFKENDTISSFEELNEKHSTPGFQFRKTADCVLYYNLQFDEKRHFPRFLNVLGWIKISMFSYNLVEIHYRYLIGLHVEQMQHCLDLEC